MIVSPLMSALLWGVAFFIAKAIKLYAPRFAGWNFFPLMLFSMGAEVAFLVVLSVLLR